jgi:hypothetical protein
MLDRRNFLSNAFKYVKVGAGIMIVPNFMFADEISYFAEEFTIEAYKDDYQNRLPNMGKSTSLPTHNQATKKQLGLDAVDRPIDIFLKNMPTDLQSVVDSLNRKGITVYTPPTQYNNKPGAGKGGKATHTNAGMIVKTAANGNKEAGLFLGYDSVYRTSSGWETNGKRKNYHVHQSFLQYVSQYEAYFCYGQPCSNPTTYTCTLCNQDFHIQDFFYEGDSKYERKKRDFWDNGKCNHPDAKKNDKEYQAHTVNSWEYPDLAKTLKTVSLEPIKKCLCVDNLKSNNGERSL